MPFSAAEPQSLPPLGSTWFHYQAQVPPQTHLPMDRTTYYDTPTHTYLIGTNAEGKDYRLIKFTKDDEKLDVHFSDVYDRDYMVNLVRTIKEVAGGGGAVQCGKAKGILGFVRFTKGYYMILITRRREVARIGTHRIFHVSGTTMVSLCEPQKHQFLRRRSDEEFYRDLFMKFELDDAYFYYSHTYDITNKLQTNMTGQMPTDSADPSSFPAGGPQPADAAPCPRLFGRLPIRRKFVWNEFLLEPTCVSGPRPKQKGASAMSAEYTCSIAKGIHVADAWLPWIVFAIRGCVSQCRLETTASPVTVVLIGRTSKNFAGTRYLRRGVNEDGHVANHVEVEQIVFVNSSLSHCGARGRFSSYVQVRGSVPVHWFHGMVQRPKPPILLGKVDPFYNSTRLHLEEILSDFGAPVVLMNLLKTHEKKKREFVLTSEYVKAFSLLTAHMEGPRDAIPIRYHSFDLRNAADRAWNSMTAFGEREGDEIGIFACDLESVRLQSGVVRSNCVDCIDRTNLAQFFFGLHALGKQLTAVGILHHEVDIALSQQSAYDAMLRLYLRLGDAIAIQYGGSAQVGAGILHRGLGWDKMMGIKRLYNNLVVDKDRQQIMNLFLGLYEPCPNKLRLGNRLTLPLHRKALVLHESAVAAYATAVNNDRISNSDDVTPSTTRTPPAFSAVSATGSRRRGGSVVGSPVGTNDAPSYWDIASTVVDEATAFAMRRVVDIQEVEADYYLHCSAGPTIGASGALHEWWVAPLGQFAARYEHIRSCTEDGGRVSRYSRRRRQSSWCFSGGGARLDASGSLECSMDVDDADISPTGSHPQHQFRAPPPPAETARPCPPYYLLTSKGHVLQFDSEEAWRGEAMHCWLRNRGNRGGADSDDEPQLESATADMSPQPLLRATNTRTTLASTALKENPQEFNVPGKLSIARPPQHGSWFMSPRSSVCLTAAPPCMDTAVTGTLPDVLRCGVKQCVPLWQLSPSAKPCERTYHQPLFVVADPIPEIYWDHGPDYGNSFELVHNHLTFPDEVHHSIHKRELDELRRACDRPPSDDAKRRAMVTALLRFGDPLLWTADDLCDALELTHGDDILAPTLEYIRQENIFGARFIQWGQWDHFRQATLLRSFVGVMRMIPSTDERAVIEAYVSGPGEPNWPALFKTFDGEDEFETISKSILSSTVHDGPGDDHPSQAESGYAARYPCGGLAHAEGTVMFLQTFVTVALDEITADRFVRFLGDVMSAEPEDPNDRRKLNGGVPRQDRLRYHHQPENSQSPSVAVLHHAFWLSTLLNWLVHNSQRLGMTMHCELLAEDSRHRAGEFIMWLLYAGLVVPAEHMSGFTSASIASVNHHPHTGVDVCSVIVKDVLAERNNVLFTLPTLQRRLVINVPKPLLNTTLFSLSVAGADGRGGPSTTSSKRAHDAAFLRIPPTPRRFGGAGSASEGTGGFSDRDSHGTRASHADPFSGGGGGGIGAASDIAANSPLQFAECCANLAINSLSFLDEQLSHSSIASCEHAFSHVVELEHVDLSLLNSKARLCFFINIFNTLYIHAWIHALQHPVIDIRRFYHMYSYNIGGHHFSLHEIKHGVLRRNRPGPVDVLAPFAPGDPRISLIPNPSEVLQLDPGTTETPIMRARVLLALIDMYLTPERLPELVPYSARLFVDDGGSSVANQSIVQPIVYDDGFEVVEHDDSSDDEAPHFQTSSSSKAATGVAGLPPSLTGGVAPGVAFFASLFRRDRTRTGSVIPQHFCIAMVASFFHEQLNSIETNFVNALNDPNQPQTSVNQGNPYPRLIQGLIGLEDIGRSPDEIAKLYLKKRRRAAAGQVNQSVQNVQQSSHHYVQGSSGTGGAAANFTASGGAFASTMRR